MTQPAVHDHYASTDIDPACNLCQLAQAFRPLAEFDPEGHLQATDPERLAAIVASDPHYPTQAELAQQRAEYAIGDGLVPAAEALPSLDRPSTARAVREAYPDGIVPRMVASTIAKFTIEEPWAMQAREAHIAGDRWAEALDGGRVMADHLDTPGYRWDNVVYWAVRLSTGEVHEGSGRTMHGGPVHYPAALPEAALGWPIVATAYATLLIGPGGPRQA